MLLIVIVQFKAILMRKAILQRLKSDSLEMYRHEQARYLAHLDYQKEKNLLNQQSVSKFQCMFKYVN